MNQIPVLVIVGPTASGKSALALSLARKIGGEIISADSMQIYKGMDIGTAKPSIAQRKKIRHHMIDFLPISKEYSAFNFRQDALGCMHKIQKRAAHPIVVGGTGLYVRALLEGMAPHPGKDDVVRERLANEYLDKGAQTMHERLKLIDPMAADRIHPNDAKRVIRALEVYEISGKKITDWEKESKSKQEDAHAFVTIGVTMDRQALYEKIDQRVDLMFRRGWLREVKTLADKKWSLTAQQAIGYRSLLEYLQQGGDVHELRKNIKQDTRRYAKRQLTWFRQDEKIIWITDESKDQLKQVMTICREAGIV